jgi:hypothetical protein
MMIATSPARRWLPLLLALLAACPATHPAAATAAPPTPPSKKEQAAFLAAPEADRISADHLAPAVRQAVANGVGSLLARITAEGNDHGLAFPPTQTMKVVEIVDVPAKRVQREHPIYENDYATVEKVVPVLESGQPTGRFQTVKERVIVKRRQVGKKLIDELVPDPEGKETIKRRKWGPGGPAGWTANLPGLNGMALFILAKAGLGSHPVTVTHAKALAAHCSGCGIPDGTFDIAWMAAGFVALGPDSPHAELADKLLGKLVDGQVRQKGELDGLWGPVCVNYRYFGKLFILGQTLRQELDVNIPKKLEMATNPAMQAAVVKLGREMKEIVNEYERTYRDVFRCGTRMLEIRSPFKIGEEAIVPGLPCNAYQWVATDVESTQAAAFALAEAKRAGMLPRETYRLTIRGKKIDLPLKSDAAVKKAIQRLSEAVDDDGGIKALARMEANSGFADTGFPAPAFEDGDSLRPMFDLETAGTTVAGHAAIEALVAADGGQRSEAWRQAARGRAAAIAERWYGVSANPADDTWKSMYLGLTVAHKDLAASPLLPVPKVGPAAVDALLWGPSGSLYRVVPGFRALFAAAGSAKDCYADDLFRRIAYRLVALQDESGQWVGGGSLLLSTATESLTMGRVADAWHKSLSRDPPIKLKQPDPVPYEAMLHHAGAGWVSHQAARPDPAVFPTLASLLFLLEGIDGPVGLEGVAILPEPVAESDEASPSPDAPAPRLSPVDAARKVARPNEPRLELYEAIIATKWPRTMEAAKPVAAAVAEPEAAEEAEPAAKKDDGLGKFEDLLTPSDSEEQ